MANIMPLLALGIGAVKQQYCRASKTRRRLTRDRQGPQAVLVSCQLFYPGWVD